MAYVVNIRVFVLVMLVLAVACTTQAPLARQNTGWVYAGSQVGFKPNYKVFHNTTDSSKVYFSIKSTKLLYTKGDGGFTARVRLQYRLYDSFDTKIPTDTGSAYVNFPQPTDTNRYVYSSFAIRRAAGKNQVAELIFTDLNRRKTNLSFIEIDNTSAYPAESYMLRAYPENAPLLNTYLAKEQVFTINLTDSASLPVFIKYYGKDLPPARPPFAERKEPEFGLPAPDTVFTVLVTNGVSGPQQFASEGLYLVVADTTKDIGLPILRPGASFPELTRPMDVLKPLRYLMPQQEYDNIQAKPDIKKAVDDFWLRTADNQTRAREALKNYYIGVLVANELFTTTREGWKTDRGIAYVIFGEPSSVYHTGAYESWMYGTASTPYNPIFYFERKPDGLTGYDYFLRRSDLLKPAWYEMVENWRNGRMQYRY